MTYHVNRGIDPIKWVLADSKAFVPRSHAELQPSLGAPDVWLPGNCCLVEPPERYENSTYTGREAWANDLSSFPMAHQAVQFQVLSAYVPLLSAQMATTDVFEGLLALRFTKGDSVALPRVATGRD